MQMNIDLLDEHHNLGLNGFIKKRGINDHQNRNTHGTAAVGLA